MLRSPGLRKSVEQPVLDLNFAAAQIGSNGAPDSRIDFSRGSNAWFVDSDGLVKKSPHNLSLYSEDFTQWNANAGVVTANQIAAPDGSLTADLLADDGTTGNHRFSRLISGNTIGETMFASLYVKATSDNTNILWREDKEDGLSFGFNPTTGQITSGTGTAEDVGNGWYRLTITGALASQTVWSPEIRFSGTPASVYVWGAQLSQHTTLPVDNPYIKTEGSAVYAARLDHDPTWFMSAAQEQNLLETTDLDDNTQYGLGRSTIAEQSSVENPFGGTDGVYLHLESAVGGSSYVYLFSGTNWQQYVTEGKQYTLSIYAKQFSGQKLELRSPNNDYRTARFNVDTGVIEDQDSLLDDVNIEDVGNGWFRCSITDTIATFSPTTWILAYLYNDLASPDYGLYYYGAQLEVGSTASTYHRTEGTPYYGEGATPKGLLIEEQRANLATDSEDFTAASWGKTNSTVTANQVLAPDGTTTADLWTRSSTSAAYLNDDVTKSAVSQDYSVSCFVKKSVGDYAAVRFQSTYPARVDGVFNLSTGAVHSLNAVTLTNEAATIEDYGNGWFRCTVSGTSDATVVLRAAVSFNSNGVQVDFTDTASDSAGFVWGFQIEEGSFPTSYIQTTGNTKTRNADVAVMGPTTGGTELVTNGTFDTDVSNWVEYQANSSITFSSGTAIISSNQYNDVRQVLSLVEGRRYRASMDVITRTSGAWFFLLEHDSTNSHTQGSFADGSTVTFDFTAGAVNTLRIYPYTTGNPDTIKVDNVSVRELYPFEQYNPSEGTVVCEFQTLSGLTKGPFHFYDGTTNKGFAIRVKADDGGTLDVITRDASNFNNINISSLDLRSFTRAVAAYNSSGHARAGADGSKGTSSTNTISLSVDRLDIGTQNAGGSNKGTMSGHIRRLQYSTRFVSELEAQNLTSD